MSSQIGSVEKQLDSMDLRAEKKLVLLHRPDTILPKNTADWLNMRGWVSSHHHIKCAKRIYLRKSPSWFEDYYDTTLTKENAVDKFSDFSRLARVLMGKAIGVVLGGGGARGAAHIGVIKAMMEAGVPIDMVGGTSIGENEDKRIFHLVLRLIDWLIDLMKTHWMHSCSFNWLIDRFYWLGGLV